MNDQAKYTVTLEFETSGADAEINNLRKLQEAVDGVAREGGIGEQSQVKLSKALHNTGVAAGDASGEIKKSEDSIISLRYANYDLANTLFATSAAITAVGAASLIAFASQESAFTEVERIAGGSLQEIQNLRDELQAMSTDIPVAFGELSNIASLGAALDIPADQLDEFTESVAKFAATTGVTVEAAATGFGKLAAYLEIPEEQFDALGSAILRAGNISVATEEQVLKFAQALALPGARIGFTTDQVVALGATLASFGNINVEGAGSALNRVTKNIERALSENGEALETWAATAGMSSEAFKVAWGSDVSGTFNRVIKGLSGNIEGLVGNLDALGVRNIRDQRIIEALALNYDKYNQILGETSSAWREGTYMNEAYGLVLDDLASKWQILVNALTNAAAAVGAQIAPAFATLLDISVNLLVAFTEFVESPLGGRLTALAAGAAALAAGWLAVRGAIALATASGLAMQLIMRNLVGIGIINGLRGLAGAFLGIGNSGRHAAGGVLTLRSAISKLGRSIPLLAVFYVASSWIFDTGTAAQETGETMIWLSQIVSQVATSIAKAFAEVAPLISLTMGLMAIGNQGNPISNFLQSAGTGLRDWGKGLSSAQNSMSGLTTGLGDLQSVLDDLPSGLGNTSDGLGGLGNSAAEASREVRTLVDYSNDLQQVWNRAFEIRFSGTTTLDAIRETFFSIREAADEAAKRIRDLNNEIRSLSSDIDIQEYFLSIAIEYGDTKRAAAIEADLAKKRAELADKTAEIQKEQDTLNKTLVGNSKVAIENRKTITDLVSQYQAHIGALAASGMSQSQLAQATKRLRADFIQQATQLGFNSQELGVYAAAFDDVTTAINLVPRNITVTANTNPAIQAFNEMKAATDKANASVSGLRSNLGSLGSSMPKTVTGPQVTVPAPIPWKSWSAFMAFSRQNPFRTMITKQGQQDWMNGIRAGFAEGGYTGPGGRNEPAGIVHRGEYVIPKNMVNQSTGLPYADALGRLMAGIPGMASGGPTTGSGAGSSLATVALTPGTIQAIAQATGKVIVLDGRVIADSSANSYSQDSVVGRY